MQTNTLLTRSRLVRLTSDIPVEQVLRSEPVRGDDQFMDYGLWITTLIFLSLMLAFQGISAGLCFFNVATVPIEMLVGPMGIYLTNGVAGNFPFCYKFLEANRFYGCWILICLFIVSGLTGLITLSLWGDLFSSNLSSELAIQETVLDIYRMSSNLGYSYWFVNV